MTASSQRTESEKIAIIARLWASWALVRIAGLALRGADRLVDKPQQRHAARVLSAISSASALVARKALPVR